MFQTDSNMIIFTNIKKIDTLFRLQPFSNGGAVFVL